MLNKNSKIKVVSTTKNNTDMNRSFAIKPVT